MRAFVGEGARVSIGDAEANDAFLAIARAYPAPQRGRLGPAGDIELRPGGLPQRADDHPDPSRRRRRPAARTRIRSCPPARPPPLPGTPSVLGARVVDRPHLEAEEVIIGQYSPDTHGCPYSWMDT